MNEQQSIALEIKILSNLIKRRVFASMPPFVDEDGLTEMQAQIIDYLFTHSPKQEIYQRDLEEQFSIRRSTVSRILRTLEKRSIILRESVSHDARLKKLSLTAETKAIHQHIKSKIEELEYSIGEGLTEEEIALFFTICKKMRQNLQ